MNELLLCILDPNYPEFWKPFCDLVYQSHKDDISDSIPALLWTDDQLSYLTGTYLLDRINADKESFEELADLFQKERPDIQKPTILDILIASRILELHSTKILKNKQYVSVISPIYATLPVKPGQTQFPQTHFGYQERQNIARIWVDSEYEAEQKIELSIVGIPDWRILELYGRFDTEAKNIDNTLPIDAFLKGYDKLYDKKMEVLTEQGYNM